MYIYIYIYIYTHIHAHTYIRTYMHIALRAWARVARPCGLDVCGHGPRAVGLGGLWAGSEDGGIDWARREDSGTSDFATASRGFWDCHVRSSKPTKEAPRAHLDCHAPAVLLCQRSMLIMMIIMIIIQMLIVIIMIIMMIILIIKIIRWSAEVRTAPT